MTKVFLGGMLLLKIISIKIRFSCSMRIKKFDFEVSAEHQHTGWHDGYFYLTVIFAVLENGLMIITHHFEDGSKLLFI
jgi:hypothetical protein